MKKSLSPLLKLTNFELSRLSKFLFTLMGLTVLANLVGYIYIPMKFMDKINKFTIESSATTEEVLNSLGTLSFYDVTMSLWIVAPIAIGVSGLLFYSIFIWYREWFGKNTFAYRLLMLPVSRMTLFFSKFIVIFIGIFTLISTQIVSLFIGYPIVSAIVDSTYFSSLGLIESMYMHPLFLILFPLEPNYFLILIVGATVLLVMFTLILMEQELCF